MIVELFFWSSIFFIFYAYFGYPLLLMLISIFRSNPVQKARIAPNVSFIITAYNEEKRIGEKIENTLNQNYPPEKLEIIVASDCSSDGTDDIVKSYQSNGVKLVRAPERKGKENAQKYAVETATGEILIFSDTATILTPDGISSIVKNFNDPTVGCVSSVDKFIDREGKIGGEGAYVRYEMFLRNLETKVNTLVGLSGSFFAARKEVCRPWAPDLQSDFNTLINAVKKGYRGVSDPESVGFYHDLSNEKREFHRKVRTVVRGIRVLIRNFSILNPFKHGFFAWQLFSHKLCRWLVPFAMILAFFSNAIVVINSGPTSMVLPSFYFYFLVLQGMFYIVAVVGLYTYSQSQVFKISSFFVTVNFSILIAWYKYFKGEHFIKWEPSQRIGRG